MYGDGMAERLLNHIPCALQKLKKMIGVCLLLCEEVNLKYFNKSINFNTEAYNKNRSYNEI